jgi:hypothetical protein
VPVDPGASLRLLLTSFGAGGPHFVRATASLSPSGTKRASITCVQRRSAHRIRGTTLVVGTGGAVRPFTLCLSAQGPRWTDPTIAPTFDGLKISVSHRVTFIDRSLLRSSFLGPRSEGFNRRLSPPGFPQCPTASELRGACSAIY